MDNYLIMALVATLGTWFVTALGAATVIFFTSPDPKGLNIMLGFASGVMIAASFWSLLQPAIERAEAASSQPAYLVATVGFLFGALFMWASDKIVSLARREADSTLGKPNERMHRIIMLILSITLHNIPEGLAVAVPILAATGSKSKAVGFALFSGLAEPAGALLGYLVFRPLLNDAVFGILFAVIAGIMIFLSFDELLPDAEHAGGHTLAILGLMVGMAVMAISLLLFL